MSTCGWRKRATTVAASDPAGLPSGRLRTGRVVSCFHELTPAGSTVSDRARIYDSLTIRADPGLLLLPMRLLFQFLAVWSLAAAGATTHAAQPCQDAKISASQVTTERDVKLFVECAAAFLEEVGPDEARRAFNEDVRWKHGATYVFVIEVAPSGVTARRFVFPPNPSQEGTQRGSPLLDFGTDLYAEIYRAMDVVDTGWFYYSNPNPQTGNREFKSSYMIETDWKGTRSVIGAGLYARDLPATCHAADVSASIVSTSMDDQRLQEFVRCAAMMVESRGYFARQELETDTRWSSGGTNVFVSGHDGQPSHVQQSLENQRMSLPTNGGCNPGRSSSAGATWLASGGRSAKHSSTTGRTTLRPGPIGRKSALLKRVVAQGVPLRRRRRLFPRRATDGTGRDLLGRLRDCLGGARPGGS